MFRRPLFVPLIALIAGILIAQYLPGAAAIALALAGLGMYGLFAATGQRASLLAVAALIAGIAVIRTVVFVRVSPSDVARRITRPGERLELTLVGRLLEDPDATPDRVAFPLEVETAVLDGKPIAASGRVRVTIYPNPTASEASHPSPRKGGDGGEVARARNRAAYPAGEKPRVGGLPAALTFGQRVEVTGRLRLPSPARNPGELDYRAYLARQGIRSLLSARGGEAVRILAAGPFSWTGLCLAAKRRLESSLSATLTPGDAATMAGLLFSERSRLPQQVQDDFVATGTVHLLSTSGIHVAALALALRLALGASFRRYRRPLAALMIVLLFAFGVMAGFRPAVARAVLMAALVYGADLVDREADGMNLLGFAALALLIANPLQLGDLGFQLSFAAGAGLMLLGPRFGPAVQALGFGGSRVWGSAGTAIAASLSAEAALAPLVALQTQQVSLVSPAANLVVIPISTLLIPFGLVEAMAGLAARPLGAALGLILGGLVWAFQSTVHLFASLPGAMAQVPPPPVTGLVAYYAVLIAWARPWALVEDDDEKESGGRPGLCEALRPLLPWAFPIALIAGGALVLLWGALAMRPRPLRMTFIDVGQGDSLLVETPDGATMLVDGGGRPNRGAFGPPPFDVGERVVVPFLLRHGIRRLDVVVMTHPDDDHVGGLGAVVEALPVRLVLTDGQGSDAPSFARFARDVEARTIPCRAVSSGDSFALGGETTVEVLGPALPPFSGTESDTNNNSVVLRLGYRGFSALLVGDIEGEAEERLMPGFGPVDLLKVAHHGSRYSTSRAFIGRVRPKSAVISVGEGNLFGHPSPGTVRRLEEGGARVFRTDRDGAITVETDGSYLRVQAFLHRSGAGGFASAAGTRP